MNSRVLVLALSCLFSFFVAVAIAADPVATVGADLGAAERIARTAEQKLLQSLHKKIRVELTDAPLEEVLAAIAKEATIEVWMDKLRMQEAGITSEQQVTLNLGETTVWQALHFLLRPLSLTWEAPDGVLVVTTQAAAEPRIVRVYDVSAIVKVLEPQLEGLVPQPPRFRKQEFPRPVGNLMPAAANDAGPPLVLAQFAGPEPEVVIEEQLPNTDRRIGRRVENAKYRAEAALAEMLQTCSHGTWIDADGDGGTINVLRGSLIIRQTYQTHLEVQALLQAVENILVRGAKVKSLLVRRPAYPFDEDAAIHQRLGEPGMIDANDQTLENLFQSLSESCGIRHWLDKQAWSDEGIPTDFTVSVTRGGASRNVVLNHVLRQLGLATVVHEGTLVVTTASGAAARDLQTIAVYNTAEIAAGSPDELVSAIEACAAGKWENLDGDGGTNYRLGSGLVVIRQSQAIHGTIANVLDELRKNPAVKHEPPAAKLEQRIYPVADATAVADLVKTLPQLIPNWDAKQGSIHRLGQSVLINQPAVVHARVGEFISVLNTAHASLQAP